jgi:DNA primase
MNHQVDVEEIKSRIDIIDFISEFIELKKAGRNFKALCPFHSEKTPSFIVNPEKQIFHCFGCSVGGDVVTFVMKYDGLSFIEAVSSLAQRAGIVLKEHVTSTPTKDLKKKLLNAHREASVFFQDEFSRNQQAQRYMKKRGISGEAIKVFLLGFAPGEGKALLNFLKKKGFSDTDVTASGLCKSTDHGLVAIFRNRLIFPICNLRGDIIAFGGRTIKDTSFGPKYLNSPETILFKKSSELFGLNLAKNEIKKKGYAVLTEGYLDVISAHQNGIQNAIAPLGTSLTEGQVRRLRPLTKKLLLLFDADEAGISASRRALSLLYENGFHAKVLFLPEGEDPDSFLHKHGAEAFRKLFKNVTGLVDFYLSLSGDRGDIVRELMDIISKIKNGITRGDLIRELSEKTGLSEQFLREELTSLRKGVHSSSPLESSPTRSPELHLMGLFLSHPAYQHIIRDNMSLKDIGDVELSGIFEKLFESTESTLNDLHSLFNEKELSLISASTVGLFVDSEEIEQNIHDCIKSIKSRELKKKLKKIEMEIRIAEKNGESHLIEGLQQEWNALVKEVVNEGIL